MSFFTDKVDKLPNKKTVCEFTNLGFIITTKSEQLTLQQLSVYSSFKWSFCLKNHFHFVEISGSKQVVFVRKLSIVGDKVLSSGCGKQIDRRWVVILKSVIFFDELQARKLQAKTMLKRWRKKNEYTALNHSALENTNDLETVASYQAMKPEQLKSQLFLHQH